MRRIERTPLSKMIPDEFARAGEPTPGSLCPENCDPRTLPA
jgi:hypothetical protein